jgi:hypothetical protein
MLLIAILQLLTITTIFMSINFNAMLLVLGSRYGRFYWLAERAAF